MNSVPVGEGPSGWAKAILICWMLAVLFVFVVLFAPPESAVARWAPDIFSITRQALMPWFTAPAAP